MILDEIDFLVLVVSYGSSWVTSKLCF